MTPDSAHEDPEITEKPFACPKCGYRDRSFTPSALSADGRSCGIISIRRYTRGILT